MKLSLIRCNQPGETAVALQSRSPNQLHKGIRTVGVRDQNTIRSEVSGVGPRVYGGMPLLISRKGAVGRRAGHLLFNGTT